MASSSEYLVQLPPSLMAEVHKLAASDGVSVNDIFFRAMADLVDARNGLAYLAERAARSQPGDIERLLAKVGTNEIRPGDEIPEGWFDDVPAPEARKSA